MIRSDNEVHFVCNARVRIPDVLVEFFGLDDDTDPADAPAEAIAAAMNI